MDNLQKLILSVFSIVIIAVLVLMFFSGFGPKLVGKSSCFYFVSLNNLLQSNFLTSLISGFAANMIHSTCPIYSYTAPDIDALGADVWTTAVDCWEQYGSGNMDPLASSQQNPRVCGTVAYNGISGSVKNVMDDSLVNITGRGASAYDLIRGETYYYDKVVLLCVRGQGECAYISNIDKVGSKLVITLSNNLGDIAVSDGVVKIFYADWIHDIFEIFESKYAPTLCPGVTIPSSFVANHEDSIILCVDPT